MQDEASFNSKEGSAPNLANLVEILVNILAFNIDFTRVPTTTSFPPEIPRVRDHKNSMK